MRIILSILLFFTGLFADAQEFGTSNRIVSDAMKARGLFYFGNDDISTSDLNTAANYHISGVHFITKWFSVETSDGIYDFSNLYANCARFASRNLYYTIQINTGPDAPITGANDFLSSDLGVAKFTTSGGNENGPYPDYYDPVYESKLRDLFDVLNEYISDYFTPNMKRLLLAQYVVLGSTGDTGPWKGNSCSPSNCLGYEDNATWKNWSRDIVRYAQNSIYNHGLTHVIGFNEGNNHESLNWLSSTLPFAFTKNGEYSHDINYLAEIVTKRANAIKFFLRGEAQGDILSTTHAHRDGFQMIISALCSGMDFFNMTGGWINQVVEAGESEADTRMTDYFVKYAPHNRVAEARKAFIQLADKFSFDDLERFPEGVTYGDLIGNSAAYNSRVASINSDNTLGEVNKYWMLIDAVRDYVNSARITAISNYGVSMGAPAYNPSANTLAYGNPYGYSQFKNYEFHITQNNPNTTSTSYWLSGADTSMFGQYSRGFNSAGDPMDFDIDNRWAGGATIGTIKYVITYLDNNTGTWSLFAPQGVISTEQLQVTNTNSGKWKQVSVTVTDQILGGSTDFSLNYISGTKTRFSMIEIEKL